MKNSGFGLYKKMQRNREKKSVENFYRKMGHTIQMGCWQLQCVRSIFVVDEVIFFRFELNVCVYVVLRVKTVGLMK